MAAAEPRLLRDDSRELLPAAPVLWEGVKSAQTAESKVCVGGSKEIVLPAGLRIFRETLPPIVCDASAARRDRRRSCALDFPRPMGESFLSERFPLAWIVSPRTIMPCSNQMCFRPLG